MGNNYTGFKAGNLPNNIIYTLPTSQPLDGQVLSSNTQGILTWTTPGGATGTAGGDLTGTYPNPTIANNVVDGTKIALGSDANGDMMYYNGTDYVRLPISTDGQVLTINSGIPSWQVVSLPNFSSLRFTSAPNATVPVHQLIASGTETNIDIALTPKGTGALTAQIADNTTTGGNKRGTRAVDWQMGLFDATQVASGVYSVIAGGFGNTASSDYSTVSGGGSNTASGTRSTVSGGIGNIASGFRSTVSGGEVNWASGPVSTVSGGYANTASGDYSTVNGGIGNIASALYSTVSGGYFNTAIGDYSTISGGRGLTLDANADRSFGFHGNTAGGDRNMTISAANTAVLGNVDL
jgi:hypothetical protein